jgi:cyclopropane fatty-acyl-phospholipid synthase-like methyltransferase
MLIRRGGHVQEIYEGEVYAEHNPTWHEEDSPWKASQIRKIIEDNKVPHKRICEVGCGAGSILTNLEHAFPDSNLDGYEISPYAYSRAKTRETEHTKFHLGDVLQAETSDFDITLIIDVIEHVEDYINFLKNLKDIGTYKILHIPLDLSLQSLFRITPIMGQREGVGHLHYFFKESALATVRDCGYTIVDHCYTASRLELPNQAFSSRLMRWPRRLLFALNPDLAVRVVGGYSLLVLAK